MKNLKTKIAAGAGIAFILILATFLIVPGLSPSDAVANTLSPDEWRTISVSGVGEVSVEPDIATTFLTVSITRPEAEAALEESNRGINAVIEAIKALGIEDDDIQTANFSVHPSYRWPTHWQGSWEDNEPVFEGFVATNTIRVTIRDFDIIGNVLGAATTAGATSIGGVSFSISDSNAAYNQALQLAVEQARSKADAMAAASGTTVVQVMNISESSSWHSPVMRSDFGMGPMATPMPMMAFDSSFSGVPIQAGNLAVTAWVSVVFSIR